MLKSYFVWGAQANCTITSTSYSAVYAGQMNFPIQTFNSGIENLYGESYGKFLSLDFPHNCAQKNLL